MRALLIAMPPLLSGCWATKSGMIVIGLSCSLYVCLNAAPRLMEETTGAACPPAQEAAMPRNQGRGEGARPTQGRKRLRCNS